MTRVLIAGTALLSIRGLIGDGWVGTEYLIAQLGLLAGAWLSHISETKRHASATQGGRT